MRHAHVTYDGQPLVLLRFEDGEGALAFPHQVRKNRAYPVFTHDYYS